MIKKEKAYCRPQKHYIHKNGGDPNWWVHFIQKIHFFPSFIVKNGQEKPPQICGGFSCFPVFSSFLFLPFCCLSFSSLPLLFDILKPKKVPTRWGLWHKNQLANYFLTGYNYNYIRNSRAKSFFACASVSLVAPSTGWMLYYLCFTPSTAIGPPLR